MKNIKFILIILYFPFVLFSQTGQERPSITASSIGSLTEDSIVSTSARTQTILGNKDFTGTLLYSGNTVAISDSTIALRTSVNEKIDTITFQTSTAGHTGIYLQKYIESRFIDDLPGVTMDISGCAYNPITGTIFMIVNGTPAIFEYTLEGDLLRTISMTGFNDAEDLCWMYGDQFGICQEFPLVNPLCFIVTIDESTTSLNTATSTIITTNMTIFTNKGLEGITYDYKNGWFYVVTEKQENGNDGGRVFKIELDGTTTEYTTLGTNLLAAGYTDLSSCYYDRDLDSLILLSDESKIVVKATLAGALGSTLSIPAKYGQPEGLSFKPDGSEMYVVGEAEDYGRYFLYNQKNLNLGNGLFDRVDINTITDTTSIEITSTSTTYRGFRFLGKFGAEFFQTIPNGQLLTVERNLSEPGTLALVSFSNKNAANTQSTLFLDQKGNGINLQMNSDAIGNQCINMLFKYGIFGNQDISDGYFILANRNNNDTESQPFVKFQSQHTATTQSTFVVNHFGISGATSYSGHFYSDNVDAPSLKVEGAAGGAAEFSGDVTISNGFVKKSVTAGITANVVQDQANATLLTTDINEISICVNTGDGVKLPVVPVVETGLEIFIINNGAETANVWPNTDDDLGAGVNISTTLASGTNVTFVSYDGTNWETK